MEVPNGLTPEDHYTLRERVAVLETKFTAIYAQSIDNRDALRKIAWSVMGAVLAAALAAVVDWIQSGGVP